MTVIVEFVSLNLHITSYQCKMRRNPILWKHLGASRDIDEPYLEAPWVLPHHGYPIPGNTHPNHGSSYPIALAIFSIEVDINSIEAVTL